MTGAAGCGGQQARQSVRLGRELQAHMQEMSASARERMKALVLRHTLLDSVQKRDFLLLGRIEAAAATARRTIASVFPPLAAEHHPPLDDAALWLPGGCAQLAATWRPVEPARWHPREAPPREELRLARTYDGVCHRGRRRRHLLCLDEMVTVCSHHNGAGGEAATRR